MNIIYLESIDSTNKYIKENIDKLPDNTVVYTYNQTSGYGRMSRNWVNSENNNLYLTFLLKPFDKPNEIYANFTQYLSVVLCKILEKYYGLNPVIKWPNDILINNKKISGILAESVIIGSNFSGLALGVGINLNSNLYDMKNINQPATSLFIETDNIVDKDDFLKKLLNEFCLLYDNFIDEGFSLIKNEYIKRVAFLGKKIKINVLGKIHQGIATGITNNGSLLLLENDKETIYFIGDIL